MSDTLFQELVQISKASAYDAIKDEYKRLQESNSALLAACKEMIKHLKETDFDVCGTKDEDMARWEAATRHRSVPLTTD